MMKLPDSWSNLEITEQIGSGAYGTVYAAENINTGEAFAIKVIRIPQDEAEADAVRRTQGDHAGEYYADMARAFASEFELLKALEENPHVVRILDHVSEPAETGIGWNIFLKMELLEDLSAVEFNEEAVIRLGLDICDALEACEQQRIIHRDLKPDNILMDAHGTFKLTDFGIARQADKTGTLSVKGTFSYMAPEVYKGQSYDHRCDIYSLGLILYILLNNNRDPFIDQNKQITYYQDKEDSLQRRMQGETLPDPVHASAGMAEIIGKACAFATDKRYKSAAQLKADLWSLKLGTYKAKKAQRKKKKDISYDKKRTIRKSVGITFLLIAAAVAAFLGVKQTVNSLVYKEVDHVTGSEMNGNGVLKTNGTKSAKLLFQDRPDLLTQVTKVVFTEPVKELPREMFAGCTGLTTVEWPEGLETIGSSAFSDCLSLEQLTIPETVTKIGDYAFENCGALKEIHIPDAVESLPACVFDGCESLRRVTGCAGLKTLGGRCFRDCTALTEVESLGEILVLPEYVFEGCTALTEITLPETLRLIEPGAFADCSSLTAVYLPEGAEYEDACFENCGDVDIQRYGSIPVKRSKS